MERVQLSPFWVSGMVRSMLSGIVTPTFILLQ